MKRINFTAEEVVVGFVFVKAGVAFEVIKVDASKLFYRERQKDGTLVGRCNIAGLKKFVADKSVTKINTTEEKVMKTTKIEKVQKAEKVVKPAKAEKAPKTEKAQKKEKVLKTQKNNKEEKVMKTPKIEKTQKAEKALKAPKAEKVAKVESAEVNFKAKKRVAPEMLVTFTPDSKFLKGLAATAKAEKAPKAPKTEKTPKSEKIQKIEKTEAKARRSMKELSAIAEKMTKALDEKGAKKIAKRYIAEVGPEMASRNIRFILKHLKNETLNVIYAPFTKVAKAA